MEDSENFSKIERGSERSFGIVFAFVFLIIAVYPLINSKGINLYALVIATVFFLVAFIKPNLLTFFNIIWFKFGLLLGRIVAPIVMFLVYSLAVVPTGLIMKLFIKDLISKKIDKKSDSYWITRKKPIGSMKNQF